MRRYGGNIILKKIVVFFVTQEKIGRNVIGFVV